MHPLSFSLRPILFTAAILLAAPFAAQAAQGDIVVPLNRSQLITTAGEMEEVIVSNPDIADVHVHGSTKLSVIGKKYGITNIRILDGAHNVIDAFNVTVSQDLPAIRKVLKQFLPNENVKLDVVNTNLVLSGEVTSAAAADRAVKLVSEFMTTDTGSAAPAAASGGATTAVAAPGTKVVNLMQITSGQQVMLRVRVGEIQRTAVKLLGVDLNVLDNTGDSLLRIATGFGKAAGAGALPLIDPSSRGSIGIGGVAGDTTIAGALQALEQEGLFKTLAEPNLVALSGEKAEFLAGGEFPIPVPQGGGGNNSNTITIEYRKFGVGVQFTPYVLSQNRIRINVQPEVSELSDEGAIELNGFRVPSITTRRASTTVELAPGESFMIAGLINDRVRSQIDQIPGAGEIPILGALFRSNQFRRNETELVIAVTPYLVDPLKSSDVRLPTDGFAPASVMEQFFYGALGRMSGENYRQSQTPPLEGPIGYLVD